MIKFRHLIWMMTAAIGLMLSISQSFAQQPDVGDQPGLLPDDSLQLAPGIPQADGPLSHHRGAGHHHHLDRGAPSRT